MFAVGKRSYPFESNNSVFSYLDQDTLNKILDLVEDWLEMTTVSKEIASLLEFRWHLCSIEKKLNFDWFGLDLHPYPEKIRYLYGSNLPNYIEAQVKSLMFPQLRMVFEPSPFLEEEKFINKPQAGNQLFTGLKNLLNTFSTINTLLATKKLSSDLLLTSTKRLSESYDNAFQNLENAIQGEATRASQFAVVISKKMLSDKIKSLSLVVSTQFLPHLSQALYQLVKSSADKGDEKGLKIFLDCSFFFKFIHQDQFNLTHLQSLLFAITRFNTTPMQRGEWSSQLANDHRLNKMSRNTCDKLREVVEIALKLEKWQEANYFLDKVIISSRERYLLPYEEKYEGTNLTNDKIVNAYRDNLGGRAYYLQAVLFIEKLEEMINGDFNEFKKFKETSYKFVPTIINWFEIAIKAFGNTAPAEVWVHKALFHYYYYYYYFGEDDATNPHLLSSIECIGKGFLIYGKEIPQWAQDVLIKIIDEIARRETLRERDVIRNINIEIPSHIWYLVALKMDDEYPSIYSFQFKLGNLDSVKVPGLIDRKGACIHNTSPFAIYQPREL